MATNWKDIKHKSSPEARAATAEKVDAELERLGFGKLQIARQQTRAAVAARLNVSPASVLRMERRADLLLSTLRSFIEALDGRLELYAVFPNATFEIDTLAPEVSPGKRPSRGTTKTRKAKAS